MKRVVIIAIAVFLALNSCSGQTGKTENENSGKSNVPKTNIKVKKEYDDHGNLIRYDSTYSYVYSNLENDSTLRDSVLNNFRKHFNENYFFSNEPYFNDLFFQDSLLRYDFFKKDFFLNRFKFNSERMDKLFEEMDSVKNSFFRQQLKPDTHRKL